MHLLKRSTVMRCGAVVAGVALLVPLASTASVAEVRPSLEPLTAVEGADFVTMPGTLQAPSLITSGTGQEDPGYLLTTPAGFGGSGYAAMYDNSGQLVWNQQGGYINLSQIEWQGQPALVLFDMFMATHLILDQSYNQIATVTMQNQPTDGHDFEMSPDGTRMLVEGWAQQTVDLSPWGGPTSTTVSNPVIQEQVVGTGEVTFEWSALDHVPPDETTEPMVPGWTDLYHLNSVEYDDDGNILTSFRNTSTVYKIDINTGDIIWRFGGERNDFTFAGGEADMPSYQHDARRLPDGRLSVFDNGNTHSPQESRGAIYTLDETTMTATLDEDLRANPPAFSEFIGGSQPVSNGNQIVGFGVTGRAVEFADGQEVFSAQFDGSSSYRTERTTGWTGTPAAPPDVVVRNAAEDGSRELYVSWNGATEVDSWRIETGPSDDELTEVGVTPKTGFETGVKVFAPEDSNVFRVTALDDSGKALITRTLSTS